MAGCNGPIFARKFDSALDRGVLDKIDATPFAVCDESRSIPNRPDPRLQEQLQAARARLQLQETQKAAAEDRANRKAEDRANRKLFSLLVALFVLVAAVRHYCWSVSHGHGHGGARRRDFSLVGHRHGSKAGVVGSRGDADYTPVAHDDASNESQTEVGSRCGPSTGIGQGAANGAQCLPQQQQQQHMRTSMGVNMGSMMGTGKLAASVRAFVVLFATLIMYVIVVGTLVLSPGQADPNFPLFAKLHGRHAIPVRYFGGMVAVLTVAAATLSYIVAGLAALIRRYNAHTAVLPATVTLYVIVVGTLVLSPGQADPNFPLFVKLHRNHTIPVRCFGGMVAASIAAMEMLILFQLAQPAQSST